VFETFLFFFGFPSSSPDSPSLTVLLLFFFLDFIFLAVAPPFLVALPLEVPFNSSCKRFAICSSVSTSTSLSRFGFLGAERGFAGEEAGSGDATSFLTLLKLGRRGFVSSSGSAFPPPDG
jgi:hypothetical protein